MASHETIRCPHCGHPESTRATVCSSCRGSLEQLCECGATAPLAATACASCGSELDPPTYRRRPVALRVVAVLVLLALVTAAGAAYWNARQRKSRKAEIWRLSDAAFDAVKAGRYAEARPLLERYLEARPRDAQMQYLLAVTEGQLDPSPLAGAAAARRALDIDGSFSEAAAYLAQSHDRAGDVERAYAYALRAVEGSRPRAQDYRVLASLEARRTPPDLEAAIAALNEARQRDPEDVRVVVLLAMLELRRAGPVALDALPDDVLRVVARAENIVFGADSELRADAQIRLAEVELTLARGASAPGIRLAERLLADDGIDPAVAVRALVLLGRARFMEGDATQAERALGEALERAPSASTGSQVVRVCRHLADLDTAQRLVAAAAEREGADPRLGEMLAALHVARGDVDAAVAALRRAAARRPDDPKLLVSLGDALLAQGRVADADEAFARAESVAEPGDRTPSLRRALLSVSVAQGLRARREAAAAAIARLDERWGAPDSWQDARALEVRGRLAVLAGRVDEGHAILEAVLRRSRHDPAVRISLAEAEFARASTGSLERAATLLRRAGDLAPYEERSVTRAARLFLALGDASQAYALCRRFLDRMGDRPAVLEVAADALRRMGRWGEAAESLSRLRSLLADESGAILRLQIDSLLRDGDDPRARRIVDEEDPEGRDERLAALLAVRGATPDERLAQLRRSGPSRALAYALLARGEADEALDVLRQAVANDPGAALERRTLVLLLLDADGEVPPAALGEARRLADETPLDAPPGVRAAVQGAVALAAGDADAAFAVLDEAVGAVPDDPFVSFLYGRALFERGDRRAALSPLRRAVVLPGALPGFALVLSRCLLAVANDSDSEVLRERLLWESLLHDTWNVGATVELANLLFTSRRDAEAAALARRLVATREVSPELAASLRRLAMAATLRSSGLGGLVEMVDDFPFDDLANADRLTDGLLLLQGDRTAEAAELLEAVHRRHPDSAIATIGLVEAQVRCGRLAAAAATAAAADQRVAPSIRYRLAHVEALLRVGRHGEARDAANPLAAQDVAHERLAEARVRAALELGDVESALSLLEEAEAAAVGPAAVRLALLRAAVLREHGSAEEALALVRSPRIAGADDPALSARVRVAEAQALLRLGRFDALSDLEPELDVERLAEVPDDDRERLAARAAFVRGTLAMVEGRTDDAVRWLRISLRLEPSDSAAANNLAWLFASRPSRVREGLELARGATEADPENADYWDTRGACARTAGLPTEAESSWNRALELAGPAGEAPSRLHVSVWAGLAELLADTGRFEEAVRLARRVLAADPPPGARARAEAVVRLR
jgi:tetratricopeptide (TPR) repeat protein